MGSKGEATDQDTLAPDFPSIFLGKVGLNLAVGLVTSCCGHKNACWGPAFCWLW